MWLVIIGRLNAYWDHLYAGAHVSSFHWCAQFPQINIWCDRSFYMMSLQNIVLTCVSVAAGYAAPYCFIIHSS